MHQRHSPRRGRQTARSQRPPVRRLHSPQLQGRRRRQLQYPARQRTTRSRAQAQRPMKMANMAGTSSWLEILYEDNHCLAVSKPAPLLTQAPAGVPSLEAMVKDYLREKYGKQGRVYLGIPHRLDRPVSGVVLFARQTVSAQRLAEQFAKRQVGRSYWGAVEGDVQPPEGRWHDWLLKIKEEARTQRVVEGAAGAREAALSYRTLGPCAGGTLVEFLPETGRMHQIRAQTAGRGWPIRGDS